MMGDGDTIMKALVVGGNSGIGLSIVCDLLMKDFDHVYIVGKDNPDVNALNQSMVDADLFSSKTSFVKANLVCDDYSFLRCFDDINVLIITAGFGRVALFENITEPEITNLIKVDLYAAIRIVKYFFPRIKSNDDFYTAIMVSICGRIVSPFFSVYGSCKGGLRFFIENINCELEASGFKNRILEVSPGSLKGTNFNGKGNNLSLLTSVSSEIVERMFNRYTLYIPEYDNLYKNILDKYNKTPASFGLESYSYKKNSGRISLKPQVVVGYLSGTFDLFHIGHLNLLKRAKAQCDYLIVSVHCSGAWKGKDTFIPYDERKAIVESIKYVDKVAEDFLEDSDAWNVYHYDKLFVGSDYKGTERFNRYEKILSGKAEIVYFPYTKGTSSTQLRDALKRNKR